MIIQEQWFLTRRHASPGGVNKISGEPELLRTPQRGMFFWAVRFSSDAHSLIWTGSDGHSPGVARDK